MKDGFVKVAVATPVVRVADCTENAQACAALTREAAEQGVKIVVFPELCLTGYTCGDLFAHDALLEAALASLRDYLAATADCDTVSLVGLPLVAADKIYNVAAVCHQGQLLGLVPKSHIPDYGAHDETRVFAPAMKENITYEFDGNFVSLGTKQLFVCTSVPGLRIGVEICEDLLVATPPSSTAGAAGATVICNLSASAVGVGKESYRRTMVESQSARTVSAYLYANSYKGESTTDLVFSGHAMIAENGVTLAERAPFALPVSGLTVTDIDLGRLVHDRRRMNTYSNQGSGEYTETYFELELEDTSLTRPVEKNPFVPDDAAERSHRFEQILATQAAGLAQRITCAYAKKLVLGISGGLDSCLALLVAVRAMDELNRPHTDILAVTMPCFGTTERTKNNATVLCEELGVDFRCVDIGEAVKVHFRDIGHADTDYNVVYENAQARERTQVLMDIANAEGGMVLGTGDLSELALGWATYNGDHMSMYGVNADIPKTLVRHLVRHVAKAASDCPTLSKTLLDIVDTPVSPELLPADGQGNIAQKTEDLVGPYELHDFYLYYMLRFGYTPRKLFRLCQYAWGDTYDDATMLKWLEVLTRRFFSQQFKRSCLPDGPKVGSVDLSPRGGLRMPSDASSAMWMKEIRELKEELGL